MRPDKRYGAFLILSIVFLTVFIFSSSRFFIRGGLTHGAAVSRTPSAHPDDHSRKAVPENKGHGPAVEPVPLPVFPVDINTARVEELMLLPGIGEKTAQRIIEKRKELGAFRTVDELTEVKWIGKAKLARIRDLVTINGGRRKDETNGSEGSH